MSKKHHGPSAPVPPGNRPQGGGGDPDGTALPPDNEGAGFQEQDPKRRLGDFTGTGEHARVQPSPLNDGAHGGHGGRSKD